MPPSGRSRYPHAFSRSAVKPISEGSRRGAKAPPPPAWHYPGGQIPDTAETYLLHGLEAYAHCYGCGRHPPLDLEALVAAGLGTRPFHRLRPVCAQCGSRACYVDTRAG